MESPRLPTKNAINNVLRAWRRGLPSTAPSFPRAHRRLEHRTPRRRARELFSSVTRPLIRPAARLSKARMESVGSFN